jgi:hypothetical protein
MTDHDTTNGSETDPRPSLGLAESLTWEQTGKAAIARELYEAGYDAAAELEDISEALRRGEDVTAEDVRRARLELTRAHRALEEFVAPATEGTRAWGQPLPDIPYGRLEELLGRDEREGES